MKSNNKRVTRTVNRIIDGDTFYVNRNVNGFNYIRIEGVDTPEKNKKKYDHYKRKLSKLILGEVVSITPIARSYDRLLAKVTFNRKNVGKLIGGKD